MDGWTILIIIAVVILVIMWLLGNDNDDDDNSGLKDLDWFYKIFGNHKKHSKE